MGQWPRTTGWTSRPEATFINLASAKATFVKVKSNRVNYKSKLDRRQEEIYFLGCNYCVEDVRGCIEDSRDDGEHQRDDIEDPRDNDGRQRYDSEGK